MPPQAKCFVAGSGISATKPAVSLVGSVVDVLFFLSL